MDKLFWGLLFVYLDFKITLADAVVIGLIPDFLGYIFILQGCDSLLEESVYFRRGKVWAFGMVIWSVILYGMDLFNLSAGLSVGNILLGIAGMAAGLMVSWHTVRGVLDMERARSLELQGEKLRSLWLAMAVLEVFGYLLSWVPVVGTVAALALLVVSVCFLAAFRQSGVLYRKI